MALTQQQIQDYYKTQGNLANPLSPAQYEANLNVPISSDSLKQAPTIPIVPKPISAPIPIAGGQAIIDANSKVLMGNVTTPSGAVVDSTTGKIVTPPPTPIKVEEPATAGLSALFAKYFPKPPESTVDTYKTLSEQAGITAKENELQLKQQAVKESQSKLAAINARIAGISAQSQADVLALEGQGRGIDQTILSRQANEIKRQAAIQAIPIQAEAMVAQAEVASAQGDLQLAQGILKQAEDHLDRIFTLKMQDVQSDYNFRNKQLDAIFDFATAKEKARIEDERTKNSQEFQLLTDSIGNQQDLAKLAIQNGQGSLGAQIAALDPKSDTFKDDLGRLGGQIIPKSKDTTSFVSLSTPDRQALLAVGLTQLDIQNIERDINEYGIDKVLEGITDEKQKKEIKRVYSGKKETEEEEKFITKEFLTTQFANTTIDSMLKTLGKTRDEYAKFWSSKDTEEQNIKNDFNTYIDGLMPLVEQYRKAGYTDKEILKLMQ